MSVKCQAIMNAVETLAPKKIAEDWDNVGLMIGNPEGMVNSLLIALDATMDTIEYAVNNKYDIIVTHHPLIFSPVKSIRENSPMGEKLYKLIRNNIMVYSAHTNFDIAREGINDYLCDKLEIYSREILKITADINGEKYGIGRIGKLSSPVTLKEFVDKVKKELNLSEVKYTGDITRVINKVAVVSGSGTEYMGRAAILGAQAMVTGDLKYHQAQEADELSISIIDAGHFGTENISMEAMYNYLKSVRYLKDLKISLYDEAKNPIKTI